VIELRVRDVRSSNAYRTVYAAIRSGDLRAARLPEKVDEGIKTSKRDIDMIDRRLRDARDIDRARAAEEENDDGGKLPKHEVGSGTCLPMSACPTPSFTC
jgi:hypothetical protein